MNGGIYTAGPLYRPDPAGPQRDYRPPEMPARYQARNIQIEQVGLRPSAELVGINHPDQKSAEVRDQKQLDPPLKRFHSQRGCRKNDVVWDKPDRSTKTSLTQKLIKRLKFATDYVPVTDLIALAPGRLDVKSVANLLHRYRLNDQIVTRRSEDGTQLEYCWGAIARTGEQHARQAKGRSISPNSLTFWICTALRSDRERWMSTEELAEAVGTLTTTVERPKPATVSNRLSPLIRSGRLERRPREGAKHGHGSTMEYRLTTAF